MKSYSIPFFLLIGSLTLATIVICLSISFLIAIAMPAPDSPPMSLEKALEVLTNKNAPLPHDLTRTQSCIPPAGPSAPLIVALAARKINVGTHDIRAVWQQHSPTILHSLQVMPFEPSNNQEYKDEASPEVVHALNELNETFLDVHMDLPAFTLGERQADGCWLIVKSSERLMNTWRLRIFCAFLVCAIVLAPIAWYVSRNISRPLKHLSLRATNTNIDDKYVSPHHSGAREIRIASLAIDDMQKRLRDQMGEIMHLLAAIAHDLRTPLTGLRVRAEIVQGDQAEHMISDIDRMAVMIDQFLDFSKGQLAITSHKYFDLAALVRECVIDIRALDGHVELSETSLLSLMIYADELGLRRALTNLLSNAVRYADTAFVKLSVTSNIISLVVDDDGPGIPYDQIERLQKPFQRLENSRNAQVGGVGLGLTIVHTVANRHGGHLILTNREGGGLRALIELPSDLIAA
jgi:signal transduction histidine kinase